MCDQNPAWCLIAAGWLSIAAFVLFAIGVLASGGEMPVFGWLLLIGGLAAQAAGGLLTMRK